MAKSTPAAKKAAEPGPVEHKPTQADLARAFAAQDELAAHERMRKAARRDPVIARLLDERDRLAAENADLRKQLGGKPDTKSAEPASPEAPASE